METWLTENHKGSQEQRTQFAEELKKHLLASRKKVEEERAKTRAAAQEAKEKNNSLCKWRLWWTQVKKRADRKTVRFLNSVWPNLSGPSRDN